MHRVSGYIDGRRFARQGEVIDVLNPYTEKRIAAVEVSDIEDVHRAVNAARSVLPGWSSTPAAERAHRLRLLGEALEARRDLFVDAIIDDLGAPRRIAEKVHVDLPLTVLGQQEKLADAVDEDTFLGNSVIVSEPRGVVAAVAPWNYPLHQVIAKVAPALTAGCTVVLKPSEVAPLVIDLLIDSIEEVGLPSGVINVVWGPGQTIGEALVAHPDVDFVSFTGSTAAGRRVASLAGGNGTPLALELGGKSASVVLPGAPLEHAVRATVASCLLNSGQTCNALTRLIVPAESLSAALEIAGASAARATMGDPGDAATRLGPLASRTQRDRVRDMITRAVSDGATVVVGDATLPDSGYFVAPTVLAVADPGSDIAQNEVFGPVLVILAAADTEEAVAIANGTPYGLAGAVWGEDADARAVAHRLRTGMVDINGGAFNPLAPFGGVGASGYGRELGPFGVEEYLRKKSLQLPATA